MNSPKQTRVRIHNLADTIRTGWYELALLMAEAKERELYRDWGYEDYLAWASEELGYQKRITQYMVAVAEHFGTASPKVQQWIAEIGVAKAKELIGLVDEKNLVRWQRELREANTPMVAAIARAVRETLAEPEPAQ